eukprot:TRINITY_DN19446_c0_g1_i2.p1 TRINITY_DN19446_c0_g1~~TRINITY_DN19446_c0_g1_i2.p1  ORF type:complete len:112 (+),score=11.40 TRINITY_DN19446_c0_g1_i2:353-688(+)
MDREVGAFRQSSHSMVSARTFYTNILLLTYQSFGVIYGDLGTSPLYVYRSAIMGKLQKHLNEDAVLGVFSLIFWSLTLIPLIKYILIVLSANDNGEGNFSKSLLFLHLMRT